MVQRAYCSECGGHVTLDSSGVCPGRHARSSYRGVTDTDAPADVMPSPVPVRGKPRGLWLAAAAAALALVLSCCTLAVLATSLVRNGLRSTAEVTQPYPPLISTDAAYSVPSRKQKEWALATAGLLTSWRGERLDLLGGAEPTPETVADVKAGLANQWGVRNRAELLETLAWIENGGHRRGFDQMAQQVASATPDSLERMRRQVSGDVEAANQIEIVSAYAGRFGAKSIAGWDYGRYVALCSWGYRVGYLSEDEAWRRIMPAATLMQATFSSWEDLAENYLTGRMYWSLRQTNNNGEQLRGVADRLLADPTSPWVRLPWDLDLRSTD